MLLLKACTHTRVRARKQRNQNELDPLNDFVDQDFVGDVDIDESAAEIDDLLEDLPPTPFDWDNRTHQDALDEFYLKNVTDYRHELGIGG